MLFVIGGMSGIMLANPTIDYQVHNTLFLVAHFHNVLIPGLLFGMLAAYHFWFPKAFGFRLNERWGMIAAGSWIFGFMLAFFPLYVLGLLGFPRRTAVLHGSGLSPLHADCRRRRLFHPRGLRQPAHPACRVRPPARPEPGPRWRPVGRAKPRMVGFRASAGIQLRLPSPSDQPRRLHGRQGKRTRLPAPRQVRRYRDAEKQRHGHDPLRDRRADRLWSDLAHLVAGDPGGSRRLRGHHRAGLCPRHQEDHPGRRGRRASSSLAESRGRSPPSVAGRGSRAGE